ncbi:MAG: TRAP transporter small permease [Pseudomonadota bacterium]
MSADSGAAATEPLPLRLLDGLTRASNICGTLLIFALMALIGADVLGRNLFGAPISGVPEMVSLSIVVIVFLQAPYALKAEKFTRSSALVDLLHKNRPGLARNLETLFDLVGIGVIGAILFATWPLFTRAWSRGDFVGAIGDFTAPTWPVKAVILLGCTILILQFAARVARRYWGDRA